jgi:hypothetical protein
VAAHCIAWRPSGLFGRTVCCERTPVISPVAGLRDTIMLAAAPFRPPSICGMKGCAARSPWCAIA